MIAVVGGGVSGLALGLELRARGLPCRIFESADEPGGVIRTRVVSGHRIDLGPQRMRLTPEIARLLGDLPGWGWETSVDPRSPDADRVFIGRGGQLHPIPRRVREAVTTGVVSPRGKLRMALEPLLGGPPPDASTSAADFLRRRVGDEGYRALVGPLFGGLYGSDPEEMEAARILLPALREIGAERSLLRLLLRRKSAPGAPDAAPRVPRGGMQALPIALHDAQRDAVSLGTPVRSLSPLAGGGFRVEEESGGLDAAEVVLTVPPGAAASLLRPLAPEAAAALERLTVNRIALVHFAVDPLPPGLGFQVAFGEGGRVKGVTFSGNLDGSGRTAVAFLGGMRDPGAVELDDEALMEIASDEVRRWIGSRIEPIHVSRTAMPAWDRSWRALDGLSLPEGIRLLANYTGRPGIIGRFREAARLADASVPGAG